MTSLFALVVMSLLTSVVMSDDKEAAWLSGGGTGLGVKGVGCLNSTSDCIFLPLVSTLFCPLSQGNRLDGCTNL